MLTILIGPHDILTIPEVPLIGLLMVLDQVPLVYWMLVGKIERPTRRGRFL